MVVYGSIVGYCVVVLQCSIIALLYCSVAFCGSVVV